MADELIFAGVDLTAGKRPATYAMLDQRLNIKTLGEEKPEDVLKIVKDYPSVICAINAPSGPNKKLLSNGDYREKLGLEPKRSNYRTFRVCEYEIRRRGIGIYNTHPDLEQVTDWMKEGWKFYEGLRKAGFVTYPMQGPQRLMETHPHTAFTVLLEQRPYTKTGFEGLLQRQLLLYERGVEVDDAMDVIHEWTRHRLLTGNLNLDVLSDVQLDALVAAYTAYLAGKKPENVTMVGDEEEGQIVVPVAKLKDSYD